MTSFSKDEMRKTDSQVPWILGPGSVHKKVTGAHEEACEQVPVHLPPAEVWRAAENLLVRCSEYTDMISYHEGCILKSH